MEQPEVKEQVGTGSGGGIDAATQVTSAARPASNSLAPQACPTCGVAPAANGGAAAPPAMFMPSAELNRASREFRWRRNLSRPPGGPGRRG